MSVPVRFVEYVKSTVAKIIGEDADHLILENGDHLHKVDDSLLRVFELIPGTSHVKEIPKWWQSEEPSPDGGGDAAGGSEEN